MNNTIYCLADGRLWSVADAAFITEIPANAEVIKLQNANGESDIFYLAKTLAYYDYPLGELVYYSKKGIKEELARLDAEYLTPRTLAGLSMNDPIALARYKEHEILAIPLRERLENLSSK